MHLLVCLFLKIVVYNGFSKSGSPKFTLHSFKLKYTDEDEMLKREFILNAQEIMIRKIHCNAEHALALSPILVIYNKSKEVKCHSPLPLSLCLSLLSLSVYLSFQFAHHFVFMIGSIFNLKCITPLPFKMHFAALIKNALRRSHSKCITPLSFKMHYATLIKNALRRSHFKCITPLPFQMHYAALI